MRPSVSPVTSTGEPLSVRERSSDRLDVEERGAPRSVAGEGDPGLRPEGLLTLVEVEVDLHPRHGDECGTFAGFGPGEGRHVTDSTSRSCCRFARTPARVLLLGNLPAVTTKELFHASYLEPGTGRGCRSRHRADRRRRPPPPRARRRTPCHYVALGDSYSRGFGRLAARPAGIAALPSHDQELPPRHRGRHRRDPQGRHVWRRRDQALLHLAVPRRPRPARRRHGATPTS